ncbi:hypothetical protein GCM10007881_64050 [Mesorhizobium huakuii]|uniref:HipA domain-containing protein n=1 Tax=Mesorhizobium huakuii TaxID=28104 RepID=UPI00235CF6AF|nr:HipA domain-containing protein [Mesorhizobium huakuii]GLQ82882.1 hypothetical protein GCM10007881_64050 [Mesorhizobium huakuii]
MSKEVPGTTTTWLSRAVPAQLAAVDIANWRRDESFGIFPGGTKPKQMVIAPDDAQTPLLIPNHPYLFKTAYGWRSRQMWSEFIAYRLGSLLGLPVPPCFLAVDSRTGECGALVEFFYGYPGEVAPARLVHGSDMISGFHRGLKSGRPHNIRENARICRFVLGGSAAGIMAWWMKAVIFDALIGNTDRHTENWGFLVRRRADGQPTYELAPLFDNATSLGYELNDHAFPAFSGVKLRTYIEKGRHHLGWDMQSDKPTSHITLCKKMMAHAPDAGAEAANVVRFQMLEIAKILHDCSLFDVGVPFSTARVDFVYSLIKARKAMLEEVVGY